MEQYSSIQQLLKKEDGHKDRKPIYPPTVIQAVFDGKTGASLEAILAQFNSVYVQYQGTPKDTRLIIPKEMRRAGLTITYMDMESNTITERANSAVQKDNDHWGLDVNWSRMDELSLSGDISVSAKGTWIINGKDTGVKALGPKGDTGLTPWLKTIDNKLHFSYDNVTWEPCSDYIAGYFRVEGNKLQISRDKSTWENFSDFIAAWFRWNDNKIQISRDNKTWTDFSGKFADNVHIKGYVANYASLPTGAVQGDIYGVGPTYAAEDTAHTNPIYRYYVRNANTWVDNGSFTSLSAGVVQETGNSVTEVMSQKAVSEKLSELGLKVVQSSVGEQYIRLTDSSFRTSNDIDFSTGDITYSVANPKYEVYDIEFYMEEKTEIKVYIPQGLYVMIMAWDGNTYMGVVRNSFGYYDKYASPTFNANNSYIEGTFISAIPAKIICKIVVTTTDWTVPTNDKFKELIILAENINIKALNQNTRQVDIIKDNINSLGTAINGGKSYGKFDSDYESGWFVDGVEADKWGYMRSVSSFILKKKATIKLDIPQTVEGSASWYYIQFHCWDRYGNYLGILTSSGSGFSNSTSTFTINTSTGVKTEFNTTIFYDIIVKVVVTTSNFDLVSPLVPKDAVLYPLVEIEESEKVTTKYNLVYEGTCKAVGNGNTLSKVLTNNVTTDKLYYIELSNTTGKVNGYAAFAQDYFDLDGKYKKPEVHRLVDGNLSNFYFSPLFFHSGLNIFWECKNDTDFINVKVWEVGKKFSWQKYHDVSAQLSNSKVLTRPELSFTYLSDACFDGNGNIYASYSAGTESLTESYDTADLEVTYCPISRIGVKDDYLVIAKSTNHGGEIIDGEHYTRTNNSLMMKLNKNEVMCIFSMLNDGYKGGNYLYRIYNSSTKKLSPIFRSKIKDNNGNYVNYSMLNLFSIFNDKYGTSYDFEEYIFGFDISYIGEDNGYYYQAITLAAGVDSEAKECPIVILRSEDCINWEIIGKSDSLHKWSETSCAVYNGKLYVGARADEEGMTTYFITFNLNGVEENISIVPDLQGNSTNRLFIYDYKLYISGISGKQNQFNVAPYNMVECICLRYDVRSNKFVEVLRGFTPSACHPFNIYNHNNTLYAIYTGDSRHIEPISSINETDVQVATLANTLFLENPLK